MQDGPMPRYRALVQEGAIRADPAQRAAVEKLHLLHVRLREHDPTKRTRVSLGWLGFGRREEPEHDLGGLYVYGGVGTGKSMLMDLFFEVAPVRRKRRVHFHAFMNEVHAGIHSARESNVEDPIRSVAEEVIEHAWLLCFDEFQISDITDAMILGRLFERLFRWGVVVVATSNRHPDRLYEHGLNRETFLPFIRLMKERVDIIQLDSGTDYRQGRTGARQTYFTPLGPEADAGMDA
ncbi:MAG TPA: cell division protein ZapE, partial [Thermohalobaculum sp.]|nr:cell division protein ZapE [Thermohalobaculum sp.]